MTADAQAEPPIKLPFRKARSSRPGDHAAAALIVLILAFGRSIRSSAVIDADLWQRVRAKIMLCIIDSQSKHDSATAMDLYVVERLDVTKIITVGLQDVWNVHVRTDDQGIPT